MITGANIVTIEGAIFELLEDAKDAHFKEVSGLLKARKGETNEFSADTSLFWTRGGWEGVKGVEQEWEEGKVDDEEEEKIESKGC